MGPPTEDGLCPNSPPRAARAPSEPRPAALTASARPARPLGRPSPHAGGRGRADVCCLSSASARHQVSARPRQRLSRLSVSSSWSGRVSRRDPAPPLLAPGAAARRRPSAAAVAPPLTPPPPPPPTPLPVHRQQHRRGHLEHQQDQRPPRLLQRELRGRPPDGPAEVRAARLLCAAVRIPHHTHPKRSVSPAPTLASLGAPRLTRAPVFPRKNLQSTSTKSSS